MLVGLWSASRGWGTGGLRCVVRVELGGVGRDKLEVFVAVVVMFGVWKRAGGGATFGV